MGSTPLSDVENEVFSTTVTPSASHDTEGVTAMFVYAFT